MNYSATNYSFKKNALEVVKASLTNYRGHDLIDLRIWMERKPGEFTATKKGLSIRAELFPELKRAALVEAELLEPEDVEAEASNGDPH